MVEFKRKQYKKQGKECVRGKFFSFLLISLITSALPVSGVFFLYQNGNALSISGNGIFTLLVTIPLSFGIYKYCLNATKGEESLKDIFYTFTSGHYFHLLWIYLVLGVKLALWTLCLCIPGIIKGYEYSMIPYIIAENPSISCKDAFRLSKQYTSNHKMDLFILSISFFPWGFLVAPTLGILGFWLFGYMSLSQTYAYLDLKNN